ncbi:hypothetical protein L915_12425 [Phytophthora nicotianae]|nr:hypothetical protein L915_12425 [Phytophthora nicotianae]
MRMEDGGNHDQWDPYLNGMVEEDAVAAKSMDLARD